MNAFFTILLTALRGAILISGLVVVMMMVFEGLNVSTRGRLFPVLAKSGTGQVLLSGFLGAVPGCVGGFAAVSLYTHRLVGFGALLAMLVATAGDEAFMMLALFPSKALPLFLFLLLLGIVAAFWVGIAGFLVLPYYKKKAQREFDEKISDIEDKLVAALQSEFTQEVEDQISQINNAIRPFERFVEASIESGQKQLDSLNGIRDEVEGLRRELED